MCCSCHASLCVSPNDSNTNNQLGVFSVRFLFALYSELQLCCVQPNGSDALKLVEVLTELEQRVFSSSICFKAAPMLGIAIPITPKQEGGFSACRCKHSAARFVLNLLGLIFGNTFLLLCSSFPVCKMDTVIIIFASRGLL